MKVYVHHNCNSCKKALKWLEGQGLEVEVVNLLEQTPSTDELEIMLNSYDGNLKKLFNTSGQLYRERGIKDQVASLSKEEVFELLQEEGMLVKRPFLFHENVGIVGFKEDKWVEFVAG